MVCLLQNIQDFALCLLRYFTYSCMQGKNCRVKVYMSYFDSHNITRMKFSPTAIKEAVKSSGNGTWYLIPSFS